jgi:threonine/homoserine/homoserine lactone efflux protein
MSARIGWRGVVRRAGEITGRCGHDMLIMLLVLLGALAVIAAVAWMAEHLIVFACVALLVWGVFYLGRHERTTARPGQILPRQAQPEETAAAGAMPTATLPLAVLAAAFGWGQDDQVALQPLPGLPMYETVITTSAEGHTP